MGVWNNNYLFNDKKMIDWGLIFIGFSILISGYWIETAIKNINKQGKK